MHRLRALDDSDVRRSQLSDGGRRLVLIRPSWIGMGAAATVRTRGNGVTLLGWDPIPLPNGNGTAAVSGADPLTLRTFCEADRFYPIRASPQLSWHRSPRAECGRTCAPSRRPDRPHVQPRRRPGRRLRSRHVQSRERRAPRCGILSWESPRVSTRAVLQSLRAADLRQLVVLRRSVVRARRRSRPRARSRDGSAAQGLPTSLSVLRSLPDHLSKHARKDRPVAGCIGKADA